MSWNTGGTVEVVEGTKRKMRGAIRKQLHAMQISPPEASLADEPAAQLALARDFVVQALDGGELCAGKYSVSMSGHSHQGDDAADSLSVSIQGDN